MRVCLCVAMCVCLCVCVRVYICVPVSVSVSQAAVSVRARGLLRLSWRACLRGRVCVNERDRVSEDAYCKHACVRACELFATERLCLPVQAMAKRLAAADEAAALLRGLLEAEQAARAQEKEEAAAAMKVRVPRNNSD